VTAVLAAARVCPPGTPHPGWVAFDEGRIVELGTGDPPRGALDLDDAVLTPGYVDLQVNGVDGVDFAVADEDMWRVAGASLMTHGVTAYCATLVSAPLDSYDAALARIADARQTAADDGALPAIVGVHLEGPFLGEAPGAHPPELLRRADVTWLASVLGAHPGLVRIVTLAPEADPGLVATRALAAAGVSVALGHTTATYDEARAAADAGATIVTHLFNGMAPLHHREPGLAGAALDDDRLTPTLIADLVHVHAAAIRLAFARRPGLALVSDAVATGGALCGDGTAARLADGTLAGATVLLDRAVRNVVGLGVPIEQAVAAATSVPASLIGLGDRGRLAIGARADVVALDPVSLGVRAVWVDGRQVVST
jgi:N-acetylglucosamine-6-phosphate deacetylase